MSRYVLKIIISAFTIFFKSSGNHYMQNNRDIRKYSLWPWENMSIISYDVWANCKSLDKE